MKIWIDENLCIGCGACTIVEEKIFALDEKTRKAKVISPDYNLTDSVKEAISVCPTEAIKIKDDSEK